MRITGVESTGLFTGSAARPLQIIRITLEGTPGDQPGGSPGSLLVAGPGIESQGPFGMEMPPPGESRAAEVGVAVGDQHRPGTQAPVTVVARADDARAEHSAMITVAEPGWTMWMVSHFHYDPVWWSTQGQFTEARLVLPDEDGALPDTRTAFDLVRLHLEKARRDADYKFVLAEIDYLKPHFDAFPEDRALVRSLLADGRLELVGGTYNEPNTNLTGAEVTIRNAVYGVGFQRDVLGGDPRSAWMLDSFGHDPGFPGLMAAAGLTSSSWARGPFHQWGPADNARIQFPAEFEWLSPDGTGVLTAYMANHYGAGWKLHTNKDLASAEAAALDEFRSLAVAAATRNVMLPVGGDHVIPARWVTDIHRSWNSKYVWPRFVTAIPREFFDAVRAEAGSAAGAGPGAGRRGVTPQTRDMNPLYTGKEVSYIDTKQAHRAGETAVSEGERLATLAWLAGREYPAAALDKAWRLLAYGAHHDAVTGTESDQVYLDLLAGWREAYELGDSARQMAVTALAGDASAGGRSIVVINGLARERSGMATVTITLDEPGTPWLAVIDAEDAAALPALAQGVRRHPDGSLAELTLTFRASRVPALGARRYALRTVSTDAACADAGWSDIAASTAIENEAVAITADAARGGTLTITDRRTGRPVLRGPGNELVLQQEYDKHPRWGEGPWHLSPRGPGAGSASGPASVRAQRSPVGSRLVATYRLGDLRVTQETLLWDGAEQVEFRTHVDGAIGHDHLLRVRFPALVPGGLPVYQTATAVIGRPFGLPEADTAEHGWTLDNPAHHWFGLGAAARAALIPPGGAPVLQAIGVAEVITAGSGGGQDGTSGPVRSLMISLAGLGVTATCSRDDGPRYGAVDVDSNLPDFRIALGGPEVNAFTAAVLAASDPAVPERLAKLLAEEATARLWVPAARSRAQRFAPGADLLGPRDLPVLIVAGTDLAAAIDALRADLLAGGLVAFSAGELAAEDALADGAVALFNRGTPGGVVDSGGTLWMSLMRACSAWPSGVWIDGDQRTAPDGSSFAWQHWSHTFEYSLAFTGSGDWRSAGFSAAAEDYNHDLIAAYREAEHPHAWHAAAADGPAAADDSAAGTPGVPLVTVGPPNISLLALKPRGNPLAAGRPGTLPPDGELVIRLRETDGKRTVARIELAAGIAAAHEISLLEEGEGSALPIARGAAHVELAPFGTATVALRPRDSRAPREQHTVLGREVQPIHSRYWLHGKGPAPVGNMPVAVHLSPTRVTLREAALEGFDPPAAPADDAGILRLSVAAGPGGGTGEVALIVPAGLTAEVDGAPAGAGLPYRLGGGEYATWDVTVRALPQTPGGRYFVAARISDELGQRVEDTALVTIGEPAAPTADRDPMEAFFLVPADVTALAGEAGLEVVTPALSLAPGTAGSLELRVSNHLGSELRGEVQVLSPYGAWGAVPGWAVPVRADAGSTVTLSVPVTVPATAQPGWESWLLVKLMYFGRVRYSEAVRFTVTPVTPVTP
ncbi:MAG TPA: glycoside hydrolase family 38 C-terminal domain-containing protein [Trebonia sp.]|jgi:alpha-mannosidase|nr:glycoside hydrolase family 38 C-terminal domain-containing protein [Trebonia sp.]